MADRRNLSQAMRKVRDSSPTWLSCFSCGSATGESTDCCLRQAACHALCDRGRQPWWLRTRTRRQGPGDQGITGAMQAQAVHSACAGPAHLDAAQGPRSTDRCPDAHSLACKNLCPSPSHLPPIPTTRRTLMPRRMLIVSATLGSPTSTCAHVRGGGACVRRRRMCEEEAHV